MLLLLLCFYRQMLQPLLLLIKYIYQNSFIEKRQSQSTFASASAPALAAAAAKCNRYELSYTHTCCVRARS